MFEKRLLYLTDTHLNAYHAHNGDLELEAVFEMDKEGRIEFSAYLKRHDRSLFYLLTDILKEEFHQENIPPVFVWDRQALLSRKRSQLFRDTSLSLSLSLGRESEGRKDEKILFAALTDKEKFQPWLQVLIETNIQLVGIYSAALLAPLLLKKIGEKHDRCLLITLHQTGVRQSYLENGRIRFSRLIATHDEDPIKIAQLCANEASKIQQYLDSLRLLPRDQALQTQIIAPSSQRTSFISHCIDNDKLHFKIIDQNTVGERIGLQTAPKGTQGEALFLFLLSKAQPREQFAQAMHRQMYQVGQMRVALLATSSAILVGCLLFSLWRTVEVYNLKNATALAQQHTHHDAQRYIQMTRTFPSLPTSIDIFKATVTHYNEIAQRSINPLPLFVAVSKSLNALPQLNLEQIEWKLSDTSDNTQATGIPRTHSLRDNAVLYQVITLTGEVTKTQNNDPRFTLTTVNQFIESLTRNTGGQVTALKMPFDIALSKRLSTGEVEKISDLPRFSIRIVKKQDLKNTKP